MTAPVFHTFTGMFSAIERREVAPGDTVACGHCPWMGTTTKFASHLLACPDQSDSGLREVNQ